MEILEAAERGDLQVLERLGKSTVTEAISDEYGRNCVHYAARHRGTETLNFLVKNRHFSGSSRSNIGATPALDAAAAGSLEALQWLLENTQCNVNDQDGNGATALHLSARFGHTHVIEWLLEEAHADSSKRTSLGGLALHFAVVGGLYDAVKMLLDDDRGSVNMQMKNGVTASYLASQEGHLEILKMLILEYRGNVKIAAFDGMTCVHAAAQSGHLDCVRFLIQEEKCNPNERDFDGSTQLHYAACQGHAGLIHWMMTVGGAKIMLDNLGGSPLHNAAETNQMECVKVLISNGCSIDITDNNGLTAAELARKCLNEQCAELIETYKPQSQKLVDEDILYLQSVQSPRPVAVQPAQLVEGYNKYSTQQGYLKAPNYPRNGSHDQPNHHSNNTQTPFNMESEKKHTGVMNGFSKKSRSPVGNRKESRSSGISRKRSQSPVKISETAISHVGHAVRHFEGESSTADIGENLSVLDSEKFPIGTPRQLSEDFTTDNKFSVDSLSQSDSSLSSLSLLDEVIANASRNSDSQHKFSQNAQVLQKIKRQHLSVVQETSSLVSQPTSTQPGVFNSQKVSVNKKAGYSHLSQTELKPVDSKSRHNFDDELTKFVPEMEVHNSDSVNNIGNVNRAQDHDRSNWNSREAIVSNGHRPVVNKSGGGVETNGPIVVLLTPEMMLAQRNNLVPAQARETTDNGITNDFITELKVATRGPVLKKTSKFGDPSSRNSVTPAMSFSGGQKLTVEKEVPTETKDSKTELTGEWDPKNFVDKVPNKEDLPAWKIQLQAKHIAEKTMKEELERRKIAENEARFKDMPAWKRAMIEKKEAETKAASEEKQFEPQRTPHKLAIINIEPKSGNPTDLAPWQLELKGN